MNNLARAGIAAAAVLVVAVVGYNLLPPRAGPVGPPTATSTPTATLVAPESPSPSTIPVLEPEMGALFAGQYRITEFDAFTITLTVPSGWESLGVPAQVWGPDSAVGWFTVVDLYVEPCDPTRGYVGVGPTVGDLVQALATYPGLAVDQTSEVTLSGYTGTRVEVTGSELDCGEGDVEALFLRSQPGSMDRPHVGSASVQMTILDVAGERLVVFARVSTGATPDIAEQVESIVDSTVIEAR